LSTVATRVPGCTEYLFEGDALSLVLPLDN